MGDSEAPGLLSTHAALSSNPSYDPGTPSPLTPNTRSEAEAALMANSEAQTDSAAPTTPLPDAAARFEATLAAAGVGKDNTAASMDGAGSAVDEAKLAYRRPPNPARRTSSSHYEEALRAAGGFASISPNTTISEEPRTMSPTTVVPTQGVVPLGTGVGQGQADAVQRAKPVGLSLGNLGRRQSWNEQDRRHVYSERLMVKGEGDPGYSSTVEEG